MSEKNDPLEMPKPSSAESGAPQGQPQLRMFRIPAPDPKDPRAICPWCGVRIMEMDIHIDLTPIGTVMLTFRCKNCQVFQGHQIVPPDWVLDQTRIDLAGGDISKVLADLRAGKKIA